MPDKKETDGINTPGVRRVLLIFAEPKTPRQAEIALSVRKLKLRPFIDKQWLRCLNPNCRKGRIYIVTKKAMEFWDIRSYSDLNKDWEMIGWILASPRQRLVVLRSVREDKLISEEIRMNATLLNSHLTRESTKVILKELIQRHLIDSEILERIRFYWINELGMKIKDKIAVISPLATSLSIS